MEEYVCLTVQSQPSEPIDAFNKRLIAFWSEQLRQRPDDYEKVYAETTKFAQEGDRAMRSYLVEADAVTGFVAELGRHGLGVSPVDMDDTYTKYEATSPDWFQIEH